MPFPNLYDYISFKMHNKHHKLYGLVLIGKVVKIDYKEAYFVVDADYGLDIINFSQVLNIIK